MRDQKQLHFMVIISHKNRLNDPCNACLCHPFSGSGTFFFDGMKSSEKAQGHVTTPWLGKKLYYACMIASFGAICNIKRKVYFKIRGQ